MFQLLRDLLLQFRMSRASREASTGECCVACNSTDVTILAPQAYRCNVCGHEGGDGYGAWQRQNRDAAIQKMPMEQRRQGARRDLLLARDALQGVAGDLAGARNMSAMDIAGIGGTAYAGTDGEGGEKQRLVTTATQGILEARNLVQDARVKLGVQMDTTLAETDRQDSYALWAADLHMDNMFTDLAYHAKIERMAQESQRMLTMIEEVLIREFGWAPTS